ncbi:DNA polymerase III subunit gamma/tau [Dokdonia donghaensis]|uniref:DNA polymerase III subunit gamma/tau n=1 Tax=Dokdonia donghaensis DSW-1 TaxID=1300343 RepID=A0A0A2GQN8_9FLAO|nr:DNA polymerase III subunit gamma/tau [Dokdonia donghaensis]ANH61183.1 DNA polymerase III subunit tau [Dokdonia donghaensis DSW-1]KGO05609.1 DNA polymerase III subunit gamma/tau [Dokdonia donghaensis DSW-1]
MEPFIVSARKYRPTTFKDVVGQQAITNTLENAIQNNHLAQALLFCGPRGVGKTSCARILAKQINTDENTSPDEDFAFNVFELDAASNNSVDDIRSLIDQVRIPPQVGKYKVYIIDEVHMLSAAAFNAFLKTLEEPPKHAIFILATTEKHKIIPTILSRCQIFDFKRITVADARKHLVQIAAEEGIEADEEALHIIAQKADGAMRDALSIFDRVVSFSGKTLSRKAVTENLNVLDYDTYFTTTDLLLANDIPQVLVQFNDILARGFDGHHFIAGLASHFRDLMVCKNPPTIHLLEVGDSTKKKYYEQSQKTTMAFLMEAIDIANSCDLKYRTSRNQRLLVELSLMQLASITFDGEKKNDGPFIVPPSYYKVGATQTEQIQVSTPAVQQVAQPQTTQEQTVHSPTQTQQTSPVQQAQEPAITEKQPVNHNIATPVSDNESQVTTQVSPTSAEANATAPVTEQVSPATPAQPEQPVPAQGSPTTQATPSLSIRKDRVSGLSLKGLQRKKELEQQKADKKVDVQNLPSEPFTEIAMQAAWASYVQKLLQKGERIIASNLEADQPTLNGTTIELEYPNETMKIEVERAQGPLLEYLKRSLKNYDITLNITVNEEVQRKYAYTPQEKYDKLREQNPALDILRKTFDLDL